MPRYLLPKILPMSVNPRMAEFVDDEIVYRRQGQLNDCIRQIRLMLAVPVISPLSQQFGANADGLAPRIHAG